MKIIQESPSSIGWGGSTSDLMVSRKIEISQKVYEGLCGITPKGKSFDYTIRVLIDYYLKNEEFSDENAEYYDEQIEKFENSNYDGVHNVSLNDLEKRINF